MALVLSTLRGTGIRILDPSRWSKRTRHMTSKHAEDITRYFASVEDFQNTFFFLHFVRPRPLITAISIN